MEGEPPNEQQGPSLRDVVSLGTAVDICRTVGASIVCRSRALNHFPKDVRLFRGPFYLHMRIKKKRKQQMVHILEAGQLRDAPDDSKVVEPPRACSGQAQKQALQKYGFSR